MEINLVGKSKVPGLRIKEPIDINNNRNQTARLIQGVGRDREKEGEE